MGKFRATSRFHLPILLNGDEGGTVTDKRGGRPRRKVGISIKSLRSWRRQRGIPKAGSRELAERNLELK